MFRILFVIGQRIHVHLPHPLDTQRYTVKPVFNDHTIRFKTVVSQHAQDNLWSKTTRHYSGSFCSLVTVLWSL